MPLSFDASVLALKFGDTGSICEGILISIMLDIQPLPIVQPFGHQQLVCVFVASWLMLASSCCSSYMLYVLFYSAKCIETITLRRRVSTCKLARRKLHLLEIFVHFNSGSVCLRYIISVIIMFLVHIYRPYAVNNWFNIYVSGACQLPCINIIFLLLVVKTVLY